MRISRIVLILTFLFTAPVALSQSAEEHVAIGETWLQKGDYRRAIDEFSRAAEAGREKTPARVFLLRARAYAALKQFRWAKQDYQKVLEIEPGNREARQEMEKWAREGRMKAPSSEGRREAGSPTPVNVAAPPSAPAKGQPASVPPAPASPPGRTPPAVADAVSGVPNWPAGDPPRPRPQPLPARSLALANFRDETSWKVPDSMWVRRALSPLQPLKSVPAIPESGLDINDLTPAHYLAAVTAAKEAMRLVYGSMSPEEETVFDAKWAPLFEYPAQEVIAYLNKLNPLLLEFLDLRAGYVEATRSYDEAQIELAQALAAEAQDDAVEAMEVLRAQARLIHSLAAGMSEISAKIEGLGDFPNPLAAKGRARRLHDEAMKLLAPALFEGEWIKSDGDRMYLKVIEGLADGRWLIYHATSAQYHETTRDDGKPGFLGDHIRVAEDLGNGKYLVLAWILVPQFYVLEVSGNTMTATLVTPPTELSDSPGSSNTQELVLATRNPSRISFPKKLGWEDVLKVNKEMRDSKLKQYAEWRAKHPNAHMGLAGVTNDPEVQKKRYEEDLAREKAVLDNQRQNAIATLDTAYAIEQGLQREPIDKETWRRRKMAEIDQSYRKSEAEMIERLRKKHFGEQPPGGKPATPAKPAISPQQAEAAEQQRLEAERAQLEERRKLIRADIDAFHTRIEQVRAQVAATPGAAGKEQLNWTLMVLERNLQDKQDELTTLETGEWTRTRTAFDEYCFTREAEKSRAAAEQWGQVSRMLARMERQIAQAPPDQRDRLREFWHRQVTPETIARRDFDRMEQASRTIFDQTQGAREAEAAQYEELAITQDELLTGAQRIKTAADTGLLVTSMIAGPIGRGIYAAYSGAAGTIEGGPVEGIRQAAVAASNTARIINTVFESYTQSVLQHLQQHAANPQAVQADEAGAGLSGALWAIGKEAAFQAAMSFVVQPALAKFVGGQPPQRPRLTAKQMIAQNQFRMRQLRGREAVERFVDKSKALAEAGKSGASREAIQQLRQEADIAYRAIKADYFAKNYLKNLGRNNSKAVHAYNSFDRANMNQYMQRIQDEAKRQGLSQQQLSLFSNSASKGGVGMDIDLGFREPPRFIAQAGKLVPNPAYQQWSRNLTQTMSDGTVVRLTPGEYQRKMQSIMETSFTDHFGRAPDEAFLRFTYSGDPEAYKQLAWIGGKGLKTADFAALSGGGPSYAQQAGDVSLFKVVELPKNHPSLGVYGVMQEQCRGMVKDINTKLAGAPRGQPIAPNSPLGKAPKAVQDHFIRLREVMDDFATNRIGPVEAERRISLLTGGRGMVEVAEQFGVTLQGGVKQMSGR